MEHPDMKQEEREKPFSKCFDESCNVKPSVRMSIEGQEVFFCGRHARHLVGQR